MKPDTAAIRGPEVILRPGAADPVTTTFAPATASRLEGPCAHGRAAWRIDGQLWHLRTVEHEHEFLVPCAKGTEG